MDKSRWHQIREIFAHISEQSPGFRSDYLDMVCEHDPLLRSDLEKMLAAHDDMRDQVDPVVQPSQHFQPHAIGHYQLHSVLGTGGMSTVYFASHPDFGSVALKLLPGNLVSHPAAMARFTQEAALLQRLQHPALARVYEVLVTGKHALIAMEHIDGNSLSSLIKKGSLSYHRAISIAMDICNVLVNTHSQDIVHRDLKPTNVIIDARNRTRVIDFGIAKFADNRLTKTGEVIGSPAYMSPEQWRGEPVDARTDLWSVGVLLHEMLSGAPPFELTDLARTAQRVLEQSPARLPATSRDLQPLAEVQKLIDALLQKNRELRPETATKLLKQLQRLLNRD